MTLKKWRPFWSYDVEKTEKFLREMAANGYGLADLNSWTRVFIFEKIEQAKVDFQIVYDKKENAFPQGLREAGWEDVWSEGNWTIVNNTSDSIHLFPIREGILKRNRLHANIATGIAFLGGMQAFIMMTILFVVMSATGDFEGERQLWWAFGLPIAQSVTLISLAIYATRKLRAFERRHFSSAVDGNQYPGGIIRKWKFGWIYAPDLTEKWLSQMALEGYQLVRVKGQRFVFEKGERKQVSYVYDYQVKVSPNYYDIHKESGWQLKFTSPYAIIKSSLWMKEYAHGEEKPQLTYDSSEKKALVRNVLLSNMGLTIFSAAFVLFAMWLNLPLREEAGWTLWVNFIVIALGASLVVPLSSFIRTLKYVSRMRQV